MKKHIVSIGNSTIHFKETNNIFDVKSGGIEINGQADSITEFVQKIDLENQWIPYGYVLRVVYRLENSKNITAFLYQLGKPF